MKAKRVTTDRRSAADRRKFNYTIAHSEHRSKLRRCVVDRRNLNRVPADLL